MFKVTSEPVFTHEVKVMVPVDGGFEAQTFKARFRVMDVEQLSDVQDEGGQKAVLQKVVAGMEDLVDEAGEPMPYSDDLRDRLIGVPFVRIALFTAYLRGVTKAPEGN